MATSLKPSTSRLELGQIQSTILREYRYLEAPSHVEYCFLQLGDDAAVARAFIGDVAPHVTSCAAVDRVDSPPPFVLNFGLAYRSLELLGHGGDARALDQSDHEVTGTLEAFKSGMEARATCILGDDGPDAPEHWEPAYRGQQIDAVVILTAHSEAQLAAGRALVDGWIAARAGVTQVHVERAQDFGGARQSREHFGFVDGIAQPAVAGSGLEHFPGDGLPTKRGWRPIEPGEFVLGHNDESGQTQFPARLWKNGSFMVFRKLAQDVVGFREYTANLADRHKVSEELVAAKMVGRWRSGAPLVGNPDKDNPKQVKDPERRNAFLYGSDRRGHACPFGAHVRRNNPRDEPTGPGTAQIKGHRIIRRATPYGTWLPEGSPDDGQERGVLFVVINADIARQFEFVQQNWVNSSLSSKKLTYPNDRDPLIGHQKPATATRAGKFVMPSDRRSEAPMIAWDLPRFVTTRGGEYFFLPSLETLVDLAAAYEDPHATGPCATEGNVDTSAAGNAASGLPDVVPSAPTTGDDGIVTSVPAPTTTG